jgi:hypothetical protein
VFDRNLAEGLLKLKTLDEVRAFEREVNDLTYGRKAVADFEAFVRRFVQNLEDRRYARNKVAYLKPPPQLLTFARKDAYDGGSPITKVRVVVVTTLYDGSKHLELERKVNREIVIRP